jgi:hypothetical protein
MPVMNCPHCGAENFTMEGWEDLDHCESCGKPLGQPARGSLTSAAHAIARGGGAPRALRQVTKGTHAKKPRRA